MNSRANVIDEHSETVTVPSEGPSTLRLHFPSNQQQQQQQQPQETSRRRVSWTVETVDNEMLNKKKSKCCCVYVKPKNWNESSDEDENEDADCDNCRHHRKKDFNRKHDKKNNNEDEKHDHHDHHENCDLKASSPGAK